mgnify:CR=1 FL=1
MARRKMKRKTRTRRKTGINVLNLAQSVVIANATTQGLFGTNLAEFLTGKVDGKFNPGADGYSVITLPELLGFSKDGFSLNRIGGNYGGMSFTKGVQYNFARKGPQMLATLVIVPAAFKVASKLTAKPRRDANKLLDMAGLKSVVSV